MFGRDHDLIEIFRFRIYRDEADYRLALFGEDDPRARHQFLAPALTPPRDARVEIEMRIVLCPGASPEFDGRVLIGGCIGAEGDVRHQRRIIHVPDESRRPVSCLVIVSNTPMPGTSPARGEGYRSVSLNSM